MSSLLVWVIIGLGLLVVVIRPRSIAVALITVEAFALVGVALDEAESANQYVAAGALMARALGFAALFFVLTARTPETRPVRASTDPLTRAGAAVTFALVLTWLVPSIGLPARNVERAVLALVAFGIVTVATRRAMLFQILGIVLAENGLALGALKLPGSSSSLVIELGVTLDLSLIAFVAAVFHSRIFAEFGSGDSATLRSLRD